MGLVDIKAVLSSNNEESKVTAEAYWGKANILSTETFILKSNKYDIEDSPGWPVN